jgi:hypothetical protein
MGCMIWRRSLVICNDEHRFVVAERNTARVLVLAGGGAAVPFGNTPLCNGSCRAHG